MPNYWDDVDGPVLGVTCSHPDCSEPCEPGRLDCFQHFTEFLAGLRQSGGGCNPLAGIPVMGPVASGSLVGVTAPDGPAGVPAATPTGVMLPGATIAVGPPIDPPHFNPYGGTHPDDPAVDAFTVHRGRRVHLTRDAGIGAAVGTSLPPRSERPPLEHPQNVSNKVVAPEVAAYKHPADRPANLQPVLPDAPPPGESAVEKALNAAEKADRRRDQVRDAVRRHRAKAAT
ncbi:MAG: hypothetical protein ACLPUG_13695 [Acidimicrobiales bacterium]